MSADSLPDHVENMNDSGMQLQKVAERDQRYDRGISFGAVITIKPPTNSGDVGVVEAVHDQLHLNMAISHLLATASILIQKPKLLEYNVTIPRCGVDHWCCFGYILSPAQMLESMLIEARYQSGYGGLFRERRLPEDRSR